MVTIIAHPQTGAVITPSTTSPDFGTIRVDSVEKVFSNGFMNLRKRTAFIRGSLVDLAQLAPKAGAIWPGKIVCRSSFVPMYVGQEPKINPSTGEPALTDGRPVYTEYQYETDAFKADFWDKPDEVTVEQAQENDAAQQV